MKGRNRLLRSIERRWTATFGEPPAVLADPDLMLSLLEAEEATPRPPREPRTWDRLRSGS